MLPRLTAGLSLCYERARRNQALPWLSPPALPLTVGGIFLEACCDPGLAPFSQRERELPYLPLWAALPGEGRGEEEGLRMSNARPGWGDPEVC